MTLPFDALGATMPGLRGMVLLPGVGHWVQQERPAEVNRLLLDFLTGPELGGASHRRE